MVERLGEMRNGRRERIEKGRRERREKRKERRKEKGVEMTIWRGGGRPSPLASACCSASSRHCGTPPKTWHEFPTRFCSNKLLQQWSFDPENEVVGVAKWRIIRTIWYRVHLWGRNCRIARAMLSHRSFCQQWGYLFSRRSLSLQLEVNWIPSTLDYNFFVHTHTHIYIYTDTKPITLPCLLAHAGNK